MRVNQGCSGNREAAAAASIVVLESIRMATGLIYAQVVQRDIFPTRALLPLAKYAWKAPTNLRCPAPIVQLAVKESTQKALER